MNKLLLALTVLLLVNITHAQKVSVEAKLYENNELIGSPGIVTELNKTAAVSIEGLFLFAVTIEEDKTDFVTVQTEYKTPSGQMAPILKMRHGEETRVTIGNQSISVVVSKVGS
ncbi:MAG: hypothetical protein V2I33_07275 [Kangiellaceae bacterium]|jgi:hypothetical protein|nr:hypothetical protein [Kangiellaceae bacterium]